MKSPDKILLKIYKRIDFIYKIVGFDYKPIYKNMRWVL